MHALTPIDTLTYLSPFLSREVNVYIFILSAAFCTESDTPQPETDRDSCRGKDKDVEQESYSDGFEIRRMTAKKKDGNEKKESEREKERDRCLHSDKLKPNVILIVRARSELSTSSISGAYTCFGCVSKVVNGKYRE